MNLTSPKQQIACLLDRSELDGPNLTIICCTFYLRAYIPSIKRSSSHHTHDITSLLHNTEPPDPSTRDLVAHE